MSQAGPKKYLGIKQEIYEKHAKTVFKTIPGSLTLVRFWVFCLLEINWLVFRQGKASETFRNIQRDLSINYIKKNSPEEYWDILTPKFTVGCKVCDSISPFSLFIEQQLTDTYIL